MNTINLNIDNKNVPISVETLPHLSSESAQIFSQVVGVPFPTYQCIDDGRVEHSIQVVVQDLTKLGKSPLKNWQQIALGILEIVGFVFAVISAIFAFMTGTLLPLAGVAVGALLIGFGAYYIHQDEQLTLMKPSVEKFFQECRDYFLTHQVLEEEMRKRFEQLEVISEKEKADPVHLREAAKTANLLADYLENMQFFHSI